MPLNLLDALRALDESIRNERRRSTAEGIRPIAWNDFAGMSMLCLPGISERNCRRPMRYSRLARRMMDKQLSIALDDFDAKFQELLALGEDFTCQSASKRDPLSARKRDPLSGWCKLDVTRFLALRAAQGGRSPTGGARSAKHLLFEGRWGGYQLRFLKRQLSLPVSTMSQ